MRSLILAVTLFFIVSSCKEEASEPNLNGTWHEVLSEETITFNPDNTFHYNRGTEIINGEQLPKSGSGLYSYKLVENGISVRSFLSSNSDFHTHYFKFREDQIEMASFVDLTLSRTLVFEREE